MCRKFTPQLQRKDICISQRSVSHLIERYEELLALSLSNKQRLQEIGREYKQVILAIDGMQPDVGHEVLDLLQKLTRDGISSHKFVVIESSY